MTTTTALSSQKRRDVKLSSFLSFLARLARADAVAACSQGPAGAESAIGRRGRARAPPQPQLSKVEATAEELSNLVVEDFLFPEGLRFRYDVITLLACLAGGRIGVGGGKGYFLRSGASSRSGSVSDAGFGLGVEDQALAESSSADISIAAAVPVNVVLVDAHADEEEDGLLLERCLPTKAHWIIKKLHEKGLVAHVVSQNIDGLHMRTGLFGQDVLSELHGNAYLEACAACGTEYRRPFDVSREKCPQKPFLQDTIVHFGETLRDLQNAQKHCRPSSSSDPFAAKSADDDRLHIVLGSSLSVAPANKLPDYRAGMIAVNKSNGATDDGTAGLAGWSSCFIVTTLPTAMDKICAKNGGVLWRADCDSVLLRLWDLLYGDEEGGKTLAEGLDFAALNDAVRIHEDEIIMQSAELVAAGAEVDDWNRDEVSTPPLRCGSNSICDQAGFGGEFLSPAGRGGGGGAFSSGNCNASPVVVFDFDQTLSKVHLFHHLSSAVSRSASSSSSSLNSNGGLLGSRFGSLGIGGGKGGSSPCGGDEKTPRKSKKKAVDREEQQIDAVFGHGEETTRQYLELCFGNEKEQRELALWLSALKHTHQAELYVCSYGYAGLIFCVLDTLFKEHNVPNPIPSAHVFGNNNLETRRRKFGHPKADTVFYKILPLHRRRVTEGMGGERHAAASFGGVAFNFNVLFADDDVRNCDAMSAAFPDAAIVTPDPDVGLSEGDKARIVEVLQSWGGRTGSGRSESGT
eukprot:g5327.t1